MLISHKQKRLFDINKLINKYQSNNKKIIHAHGVFDLLHVGHIRHLELAKKQGDILVVTITTDEFVNKGPNRPVFDENLRSYAIASLEYVDYVCLSPFPTSVEAINIIKPNVFVKGEEFKEQEDITGGILKEIKAVQNNGGKVAYLGDIVYSSSNIINFIGLDKIHKNRNYFSKIKKIYDLDELIKWIDKLSDLQVTVIGETIIEEYIYCEGKGQSLKDPVLSVKRQNSLLHPGGALFIANILSELINNVKLITDFDIHESKLLEKNIINKKIEYININKFGIIWRQKIIDKDSGNKIFEILNYNENKITEKQPLLDSIFENDILFISDHGLGFIDKNLAESVSKSNSFVSLNIQCNPENSGINSIKKYKRADHCCLSGHEFELEIGTRKEKINNPLKELNKYINCDNFTITDGKKGTRHFSEGKNRIKAPAIANKVLDRVGAIDIVFAVSSLLVSIGAPQEVVGFYSNLASAIHVAENGNTNTITKEKILRFTTSLLK